jgi:hypothetical protein
MVMDFNHLVGFNHLSRFQPVNPLLRTVTIKLEKGMDYSDFCSNQPHPLSMSVSLTPASRMLVKYAMRFWSAVRRYALRPTPVKTAVSEKDALNRVDSS